MPPVRGGRCSESSGAEGSEATNADPLLGAAFGAGGGEASFGSMVLAGGLLGTEFGGAIDPFFVAAGFAAAASGLSGDVVPKAAGGLDAGAVPVAGLGDSPLDLVATGAVCVAGGPEDAVLVVAGAFGGAFGGTFAVERGGVAAFPS